MNGEKSQLIDELEKIQAIWNVYDAKLVDQAYIESQIEELKNCKINGVLYEDLDFIKGERKKLPRRPVFLLPEPPETLFGKNKNDIVANVTTKDVVVSVISSWFSKFGILGTILSFAIGLVSQILINIPFIGAVFALIGMLSLLLCFVFFLGYLYSLSTKTSHPPCDYSLCQRILLSPETSDDAWEAEFNKCINSNSDNFYEKCKAYDAAFLSFVEIHLEKIEEAKKKRQSTLKEYQKQLEKKEAEIKQLSNELNEVTLLDRELLCYADRIARALEMGRADTLKEAINIVLEDKRKDDEETHRRIEAQRLENENRKHNEEMQRLAQEEARRAQAHDEAMEKAAQAQAKAEQARAEAAREAERRASEQRLAEQRAVGRQCKHCVHAGKCGMMGRQANCAAFRPR